MQIIDLLSLKSWSESESIRYSEKSEVRLESRLRLILHLCERLIGMSVFCIQATVLEEMPPFQERESSILAKLKKKRPDKVNANIDRHSTNSPIPTNAVAAQKTQGELTAVGSSNCHCS